MQMKPLTPVLTDFQWLMLDDSLDEIPFKVWNSMPLSPQYCLPEHQLEPLTALAA
jgi:hypothetical protein